ncbi:MAG: translation elongation factor Ts [Lachnospiraceae bacterium]|nr:translation elongation factor Ts [Lachnoclostridium sp.]MDD7522347.1 translation elongation factor Ts [Lachnoclostridium sp.]MDY2599500.1 translation elongation factor Ts [Lachnospiraceae bacterium]
MNITASMVKELREMSGAGMMDCKKALTNTDGNMEEAMKFLKENGLAKAAKKAGRIAAEGIVATYVSEDGKTASMVEVNSETDFVAKNDVFRGFVNEVAKQAAETSATDIDAFLAESWSGDANMTIKEKLADMIAKIGENMNIRRFEKVTANDGVVVSYIHAGGKIGVLVEAKTDNATDGVKECLKNVAMQVAAMSPKYVSTADVSEEYKKSELESLIAQAKNDPKNASKPENILEKMVQGRLNKELKEVCLLEQLYVKAENKENVSQYIASVAKAEGCSLELVNFVRFETGEGLEKKNEDFAAEVAAQMAGN